MMKKIIILLAMIAVSVSASSQVVLEKLIREREQMETTAVLNRDIETLEKIWAKDFLVNNPFNEIIKDRELVFGFMNTNRINYSRFERTVEHVEIQDGMVITMGHEDIVHAVTGQNIKRRFTNIWMLIDDEWKILIRHANVICK